MAALGVTVAVDFPNVVLSDEAEDWLIYYFFEIGSILFFMAGITITLKIISRHLLPGLACPHLPDPTPP